MCLFFNQQTVSMNHLKRASVICRADLLYWLSQEKVCSAISVFTFHGVPSGVTPAMRCAISFLSNAQKNSQRCVASAPAAAHIATRARAAQSEYAWTYLLGDMCFLHHGST